MKKLLFTIFTIFTLFTFSASSQILNPVKFNYSVVKKGADLYAVHVKAMMDPQWHIYSVKNPEGGAQATEIKINDGKTVGAIKETGKMKTVFEKEFKTNQKYFENVVDFVLMVKTKNADKISGTITYMVCNNKQCLPPKDVEFKIKM